MSLNSLKPQNSKNARSVGVNAFKRFLESETLSQEYIYSCLMLDKTGSKMATVMDKFGLYLAFNCNLGGKRLAKNSVMSYFRQVKNWLTEQFPASAAVVSDKLLEKARILERHCLTREAGGIVNKAAACTKEDLSKLMVYLYREASTPMDYQDASLISLMWYTFGRASDLVFLQKQYLSVCSRGVLFVKLVRVKTSEEQGLSLFQDRDYRTCPILAIALALMMQTSPSTALLNHLPRVGLIDAVCPISAPLVDLLEADQVGPDSSKDHRGVKSIPGVHSHVNRLLDRMPNTTSEKLSSHSFRRGGAQHANGNAKISVQWILDRGAWNLSATNKAFAYVFNTTSEDQRVAKCLSGWTPDEEIVSDSIDQLDSATQVKIRSLKAIVFATCFGLQNSSFNVSAKALDLCLARIIKFYPVMKQLSPQSPAMNRLEECAQAVGISPVDLISWSRVFQEEQKQPLHDAMHGKNAVLVEHQASLINRLLDISRQLSDRVNALEASLELTPKTSPPTSTSPISQAVPLHGVSVDGKQPNKRKKMPRTHLSDIWYEWYTREPRLWLINDRKKKFESKMIVAFMKLFLPNGFRLDESAVDHREHVLQVGMAAQSAVLSFLQDSNIRATGSSSVLKHLRELHRQGKLNSHIKILERLKDSGLVTDPAPPHTLSVLEPIQNI